MSSARFGVQALIVLVLIALVSWPEQRQLRAGAYWRASNKAISPDDRVRTGRQLRDRGGRYLIGYGSAYAPSGSTGGTALQRKLYDNDIEGRRRPTPEGVLALGGRINAIVGFARTALNAPVPFARLVLRNTVTGEVEARAVADDNGQFTFLDVLPSGYIVEMLDADGIAIATSEPIAIAASELRQTTVRAAALYPWATLFGGTTAPTADEPIEAAANQGVNRVSAPARCASPPCNSSQP